MCRSTFPILLIAIASALQATPPDTEIFLAPLSSAGGKLTVGLPVNISASPGYDNQPSFTPDGAALLFTSVRGAAPGARPQTDIYRYHIASKQITRVTDTLESEYSPTVTPDGAHISVIRVEADTTQRLWRFTAEGQQPELVLTDVKPVGYHAWGDDRTLALFVLGQPPTLQIANRMTGKAEVVAHGIGRSIQRIPGGGISFVTREAAVAGAPPLLTIVEMDLKTRVARPLTRAVSGASEADTAWTPDGTLLMAHGGTLYQWKRGGDWSPIADLTAMQLTGVTRIAISPKGDRIAFVTQPKS
jgi:dipeptidyl aminopeptidase/acylaminoacyl peptidase